MLKAFIRTFTPELHNMAVKDDTKQALSQQIWNSWKDKQGRLTMTELDVKSYVFRHVITIYDRALRLRKFFSEQKCGSIC